MSERRKNAVRYGGSAFSFLAGGGITKFLPLPHGLPEISFFVLGPVSAIAGFEAGRVLGKRRTRRVWWAAAVAVGLLPLLYFLYFAALAALNPGVLSNGVIYLLFCGALFVLFLFFGMFEINVLEK
jgi:hypothetical protein